MTVLVTADSVAKQQKRQPISSAAARKEVIEALKYVDEVIVGNEDNDNLVDIFKCFNNFFTRSGRANWLALLLLGNRISSDKHSQCVPSFFGFLQIKNMPCM